jgi:tetraacyldisaccharide 4'-kinase
MELALRVFSPVSRLACRAKDILYRGGVLKARKPALPAVSVGNLAFGGTEKTPLAMELMGHLVQMGHRPAFVSRGYRGAWERTGGVLSDGQALLGTWEDAGDEPFMVARRFPKAGVLVGKDRLASCEKARELGFTAVVLDDAFQHRRLARDLDIVLVHPDDRRPLREGPSALSRADIILVRRSGDPGSKRKIQNSFPSAAVFEFHSKPRVAVDLRTGHATPAASLKGLRVFAFCGIAGPKRFADGLAELGAEIAGSLSFPDHHDYPPGSLKRIIDAYTASGARALVTTEKDVLKLRLYGKFGDEVADIGSRGAGLEGLPILFLRVGLDIEHGFFKRFEAAFPTTPAAASGGPAA